MPQIIVQAAPGERPGPVTLHERLNGNDLNSDDFARQLVERIGWALLDAEDLEETADHLGRGRREADPAFHGEAGAAFHGPEPGRTAR
ncbi:MAG: hypothetical protein WB771_10875 [Solirubrobacterales bacterium]